MIQTELQRLIYARLKNTVAKLVRGIYDFRPQAEDSADPKNYPIIIFGEDTIADANTDTSTGVDAEAKILVYSASKSLDEAKKIADAITKSLDRAEQELVSDLVDVISCDVTSINYTRDDRVMIAEITVRLFLDNK